MSIRLAPNQSPRRGAAPGSIKVLNELKPLFTAAKIIGFVEPLGFAECSLRYEEKAICEIDAMGGADVFRLVHDTFHHFVAGETTMFPERTGLVDISGVTDPGATATTMRDRRRALVDANDRIGNIEQLRALRAGGYRGPLSFEPFAASVHGSATSEADPQASMAYVGKELEGT
jgi:2-keto-myo-inositol isomerase